MTRLQGIPWVEGVVVEENPAQVIQRKAHPRRLNLFRVPWLRPLIESQWPQLLIRIFTLSGLVFTIAVGLFGSRVGSHNFAIIFVWIAWWTALKLAFIPFGGRSWCSICPIPLPGEWLQQGGILQAGRRSLGLNLRWPKRLRGSWLQSGGFLLIGLFSAVTLTAPQVTSWVLIGLFVLAIGLSLVFEHRAFCSYLCPIGGFSGMYAQASPVEVHIIEREICAQHKVKSCYQACPWGLYPVAFQDSSACGLCMECLRACPQDNLALNLRPFGSDLGKNRNTTHLDEALLALVMLGSVMVFSAVFLGPWGWLKTAAFEIGSLRWVGYALVFLLLNLIILPGIFSLAVWGGHKFTSNGRKLKQAIASQAQALYPLGLMAWIAFTVSFALSKLNFVLGVLNDPFGWGWHWLGSIDTSATISIAGISSFIQIMLLVVGLFWSVSVSQKLSAAQARAESRTNAPLLVFNLLFTLVMLWLLVG